MSDTREAENLDVCIFRFLINDPREDVFSDGEMLVLGRQVERAFNSRIEKSDIVGEVHATLRGVRRGCVIIEIGITYVAGHGVLALIRHYPEIREGLIKIAEDVGRAVVYAERWARPFRVILYNDDEIVYGPDGAISFEEDRRPNQ